MTNFTDLQTKRRSIYALGKDVELSNQELIDTIQEAVLNTPTAFNSQTSRVVKGLQEQFPLYADNFPIWSEQGHGIALYATWLALAEKNIGMNVQHYNPLVDAQLAEKYDIPANWKLRAQAPFGQIVAPAGDKDIQTEGRFKVFGDK